MKNNECHCLLLATMLHFMHSTFLSNAFCKLSDNLANQERKFARKCKLDYPNI